MKRIFISYRRDDSGDVTGRIKDRLDLKYGEGAIFTDADGIPIGEDFREHLDREVGRCDIFLAVIGRNWLSIENDDGVRRLDDPADFVRTEIESALSRRIPVVPLLAHGISMPTAEELPESIKELAFRNGVPVRRDPEFRSDMDRVINGIDKHFSQQKENAENSATANPPPKSLWRYAVAAALVAAVAAGGWWYSEKVDHASELARVQPEADVETKREAETPDPKASVAEATTKVLTKREQTIDLVYDKTGIWEKGNAAYYSPDGRLYLQWKGERKTGKWSVTEDGDICWEQVPGWELECEAYSQARTDEHRPGDPLNLRPDE